MNFEKVNQNPKGRKSADCVVRALSYSSGKTWDKVYEELCTIGFKKKAMPNEKVTYEHWLKENGYIKMKQPRHANRTKYTVEELIDELDNSEMWDKAVVISVANHLTCSQYGTLYDTWDCSYKTVGNYWVKEK